MPCNDRAVALGRSRLDHSIGNTLQRLASILGAAALSLSFPEPTTHLRINYRTSLPPALPALCRLPDEDWNSRARAGASREQIRTGQLSGDDSSSLSRLICPFLLACSLRCGGNRADSLVGCLPYYSLPQTALSLSSHRAPLYTMCSAG